MNSTGSGEKFPILLAPSEATRYITTAIRRYSALFEAIARFLEQNDVASLVQPACENNTLTHLGLHGLVQAATIKMVAVPLLS